MSNILYVVQITLIKPIISRLLVFCKHCRKYPLN